MSNMEETNMTGCDTIFMPYGLFALHWNGSGTGTVNCPGCVVHIGATENKNLLLQDSPPAGNCKRRTARGITSPSVTYPRGGVPHPGWGVPHPDLARGYLVPVGTLSWILFNDVHYQTISKIIIFLNRGVHLLLFLLSLCIFNLNVQIAKIESTKGNTKTFLESTVQTVVSENKGAISCPNTWTQ